FRALEHHVLEEMGDAALARQLVTRADLIEEGRGDDRGLAVLQQTDGETVVQVREPRTAGQGGLRRPRRWRVLGVGPHSCLSSRLQSRLDAVTVLLSPFRDLDDEILAGHARGGETDAVAARRQLQPGAGLRETAAEILDLSRRLAVHQDRSARRLD